MSFVYILPQSFLSYQKTHRWKSNMPSTKCQKLKHFCKKILMSNLTLSNVGNRCRIVHDVKPGCLLTWRPLETLMRKSQNWQSSCVRAAPFSRSPRSRLAIAAALVAATAHLLLRRLPSTAASRRRARGARSTSSPAAPEQQSGGVTAAAAATSALAVLPSYMRRRHYRHLASKQSTKRRHGGGT